MNVDFVRIYFPLSIKYPVSIVYNKDVMCSWDAWQEVWGTWISIWFVRQEWIWPTSADSLLSRDYYTRFVKDACSKVSTWTSVKLTDTIIIHMANYFHRIYCTWIYLDLISVTLKRSSEFKGLYRSYIARGNRILGNFEIPTYVYVHIYVG